MADLALTLGQTVAIEGDSITDAHKWSHYVAAWFYLRYPELELRVTSYGRGGSSLFQHTDSSDDGNELYSRIIRSLEPHFVLVMLGHNGGATAANHKLYYEDLIDNHVDAYNSATTVLIGAHPQRTLTDAENGSPVLVEGTGKPILGDFDDKNEEVAVARSLPYVKLWQNLKPRWTNLDARALIGGADITHPGTAGHIAIAYHVITGLGWGANVSSATIAANTLTVTSATDCTIGTVTANAYGGIDFPRLDERLPWAIDEAGRADAVSLYAAIEEWQDYLLTVTGLTSGTHSLYIDGASTGISKTHVEWAAGVNLADMTTGPIWEQCQEVLGRVRDLHWVDRTTLADRPVPRQGLGDYYSAVSAAYGNDGTGLRGAALLADADVQDGLTSVNALTALIHSTATPVNRTFSLRLQGFTEASMNITTLNATTLTVG